MSLLVELDHPEGEWGDLVSRFDEVTQRRRVLAQLTDELLTGEGKPHRYGTQLRFAPDGGVTPAHPLEAPGQTNARRAALGLPAYPEYLRQRRDECRQLARSAGAGR